MISIVIFAGYFPTEESIDSGRDFLKLFQENYADCMFFIGLNPADKNEEFINLLEKSGLNFLHDTTPENLIIDSDASSYQTALRLAIRWFHKNENSKPKIKNSYFFHSKGATNPTSISIRKLFIEFFERREYIEKILDSPTIGSYSIFLGKIKEREYHLNKISKFLDVPYFYTYLYFHTIFAVKGDALNLFLQHCTEDFFSTNLQDRYFFERDFLHMIWGQGFIPYAEKIVDWNNGFNPQDIDFEEDSKQHLRRITMTPSIKNSLNKIKEIYQSHEGNISQKFESYLLAYEKNFLKYKELPINILEVGVQNGGSLEIWSKYFKDAKKILGIDINQECKNIKFDDERIKVIIGSAISNTGFSQIISEANSFDIIIDDGSHFANDIISTFYNYFPLLNPGGTYVIEDMHASYWENYGGGLHNQKSAHNFFKNLTDALNADHLRDGEKIEFIFQTWMPFNEMKNFLSKNKIYSILFQDSMIFIEKASIEYPSGLGEMIFSGSQATVEKSILRHRK